MKPPPKPSFNGFEETLETRTAGANVRPPSVEVVANASYFRFDGSRRRSSHVTPTTPLALVVSHGKNSSFGAPGETTTLRLHVAPPLPECATTTWSWDPVQL